MFRRNEDNGLVYMTAPNIKTVHAFTTRMGGVSRGIYKSLNLGENRGDMPENVTENYERLKKALGIRGSFVFSKQVHKTEIRKVTEEDRRAPFDPLNYEADGLITDIPELPLIIFTADCIPILFYDEVKGAVAAVHAGWRGTVGDIAGKAVRKMTEEYGCDPKNIFAAIGPGIGKCCFETGNEVPDAVLEILGEDGKRFIEPKNGKYYVNLPDINRELIIRAGVDGKNISVSGECTKCRHNKYWSNRYTKGMRGSQASVIMLKGNTAE